MDTSSRDLRALFINENLGGHATMHAAIRRALGDPKGDIPAHGVSASFLDVDSPGLLRKLAAAPVPGLDRLDLDLQPLRYQLAQSLWVRRRLAALPSPDVVHAYTHNAVLLSPEYLRVRPSVVSLDKTGIQNSVSLPYRDPTRFTPTMARVGKYFERRVYEAATLVAAHSDWAAESLRSDYSVPSWKVRVIPFGLSVPELQESARTTPPTVTFIGTSMERKGGWQLLDAYRKYLRGQCLITLVTHDDVPAESGVTVINDLRPGDDRLWSILAGTDVFAFPSRIDAYGYSVLEAMSMEVPVVATRANAISEIVLDGVTGRLVGPTVRDLGEGISALLRDPAQRRSMGVAGRQRVLERFDSSQTTGVLLATLQDARHEYHERSAAA